jgi:hypothetical protein
MTYSIRAATQPGLKADYDPYHGPYIGEARTIKAALELAKSQWKPGWAFTIRDRNNRCIRTVWENGDVT